MTQFVSFPLGAHTLQVHKRAFMDIAGFPGVVGVIDGTHVRIIAPSEDEAVFVNRMRFHSINVQLVFNADYKILDIVAKRPGSTHDARTLSESGLRQLTLCASRLRLVRGQWLPMQTMAPNALPPATPRVANKLQQVTQTI